MVTLGVVNFEFSRGEQAAEKEPGAEVAADEIGVLALPAEAG